MRYDTLSYEKQGFIGHIVLDLPDGGDGLGVRLAEDFAGACASIEDDDEVRVVTLTGAGKHFCLGTDPCLFEEGEAPLSLCRIAMALSRPIVAGVNGDARGQGLELALACDMRIAAETARFALPQVTAGFMPRDGATQLLPRIVGRSTAMEMVLLGRTLSASEALDVGLVSKVVPPNELARALAEIADAMAARAPLSLRYAKEAVLQGLDLTLEQGLHLEADLYHLLQTTEDRVEGIRSFLERRPPHFEGR